MYFHTDKGILLDSKPFQTFRHVMIFDHFAKNYIVSLIYVQNLRFLTFFLHKLLKNDLKW